MDGWGALTYLAAENVLWCNLIKSERLALEPVVLNAKQIKMNANIFTLLSYANLIRSNKRGSLN